MTTRKTFKTRDHLIGNWQSEIGNDLVGLFRVLRSGLDASRQFRLPLLFLIRLLAGVDRGSDGAGLAGCRLASRLCYLANLFRRLRINIGSFGSRLGVKFAGTTASLFVILACAFAKLLSSFARLIDSLAGGVREV